MYSKIKSLLLATSEGQSRSKEVSLEATAVTRDDGGTQVGMSIADSGYVRRN